MRELINILIPMWLSSIIAILFVAVKKKVKVAVLISVILLLFTTSLVWYVNMHGDIIQTGVTRQDIDESVWKAIEACYKINDYERMFQIAEENQLMESEEILNLIGVLYAQGIFYERDYEKAIKYLEAASTYGTLEQTFINLWLVSYVTDRQELKETNPYKNTINALKIAEKYNNTILNDMLTLAISVKFGEIVENGYEYVWHMDLQKQTALFDSFCVQSSTYRYYVCTDYEYTADIYENEEAGVTEYSNVVAYARRIEEWEVPIFIFVRGCPSGYQLFDDVMEYPLASTEHTVTAEFEYESSWQDEEGNTYFWTDTDEFFVGNEPPECDEDHRWHISGYDYEAGGRRFRLQVKEKAS